MGLSGIEKGEIKKPQLRYCGQPRPFPGGNDFANVGQILILQTNSLKKLKYHFMETPSFKEDHISQIPALQLLQKLGYTYLSPIEVENLRSGKTSNILLDDILRKQLKEINSEKRISSTKTTYISDANIENGIRALKELPMNEGYIAACETAYNLITLGKTFEQNFDGDKKSITLQYIDWNPDTFLINNAFHIAEEFTARIMMI